MRKLYTIAIAIFMSVSLSAQRTMVGQSAISGSLSYTGSSIGSNLSYSYSLLEGYWSIGLQLNDYAGLLSNGSRMRYDHLFLDATYLQRIAATRSRSLCLYGGGGVFFGMEAFDPLHELDRNVDTDLPECSFLYGLILGVEGEWFLLTKTALTTSASIPLAFGSPFGAFHYSLALGLRFYI